MKHILFTAIAAVGLAFAATAQPGGPGPEQREERIHAYRIAIFTEILQLTPDEAQGFWPVYNAFLSRREELNQQYRPSKQLDAMSDNEVEDVIKRHFERQQKDIDLEKQLFQDLRKVLPVRKIARLPHAEREFRESLLKKLQEARDRRQNMPARPGGRNR